MAVLGVLAAVLAVLAASCGSGGSSSSGPVSLNWYIFPEFSGAFVKSAAACSQASHGAYQIKIQNLHNLQAAPVIVPIGMPRSGCCPNEFAAARIEP